MISDVLSKSLSHVALNSGLSPPWRSRNFRQFFANGLELLYLFRLSTSTTVSKQSQPSHPIPSPVLQHSHPSHLLKMVRHAPFTPSNPFPPSNHIISTQTKVSCRYRNTNTSCPLFYLSLISFFHSQQLSDRLHPYAHCSTAC